jgi:hypothetical protein
MLTQRGIVTKEYLFGNKVLDLCTYTALENEEFQA